MTSVELAAAELDVLLLGSEPFPFTADHADELTAATGIERSRIRLVDGEYLSWYGSRTPDGIDYAESVVASVRADLHG